MTNPIAHGFKSLMRFSGRDRRKTFWPYAGVVIALTYALMIVFGFLAMIPIMTEMMEYASTHPEQTTVVAGPGEYSVSVDAGAYNPPVPDMAPFMTTISAVTLVGALLLAAAVSRRLHDSGRSAFWGLMPVPFMLAATLMMPKIMHAAMVEVEPDMRLFGLLFLNNGLYFIALAILIVFLCLPTKAGANRHGAEPA